MWFYYTEPMPLRITKPFSVVSEAYMKEFSSRQPCTLGQIRARFQRLIKVMVGDKAIGALQSLP